MRREFRWLLGSLPVVAFLLPACGASREARAEDTAKFDVYGFAHFDYIQDFNRVDPKWAATLRPTKIPTTPGTWGTDGQAILSVRQSRLGAQANLPTEFGAVFAKFEFDMFGVGDDAGLTTIRMRHAYGEWKGWLGGQTNSLFMDVDLFPNVIDYWGPPGMSFLRNPQLRYTHNLKSSQLAIAIEHPSGDIDAGQIRDIDPNLGNNIVSDNKVPDLTAAFRVDRPWGHVRIAGIARRIGYETMGTTDNTPKGHKTAGGGDLSLVVNTANKKTKIMVGALFGSGLSNYLNDGTPDLAPDGTVSNPEAKAVPIQGYTAYLDHFWSPKWSTSVGWSRTAISNTTLQAGSAFKTGDYASINLLYYPTKNVFFGAEGLWGQREDNDGDKGTDRRVQFSAHYSFSSADFAK
jgi:outer membrane DcaP-like protein